MANMKKGSMTAIMSRVAMLAPRTFFVRKNSGTPASAPRPKQNT